MPLKNFISCRTPNGPPSWLAPLSASTNEHRVVELADRVEVVDEPADLVVGVVEERGERLLQAARERAAGSSGSVVPRLDAGVARRELGALGHDARARAGARTTARGRRPSPSSNAPAVLRQVRRPAPGAARAWRRTRGSRKNGRSGRTTSLSWIIRSALVDEVLAQVVAVLGGRRAGRRGGCRRRGRGGTGRSRPRGSRRSGRSPRCSGHWSNGPAAERVLHLARGATCRRERGVALVAQHLGDGRGVVRDVAEHVREAGAEVGDARACRRVWWLRPVSSDGARRRAQRRDVEVGVLQAVRGERGRCSACRCRSRSNRSWAKPVSSSRMTTTFGASSPGWAGSANHGVESCWVVPIVPWNSSYWRTGHSLESFGTEYANRPLRVTGAEPADGSVKTQPAERTCTCASESCSPRPSSVATSAQCARTASGSTSSASRTCSPTTTSSAPTPRCTRGGTVRTTSRPTFHEPFVMFGYLAAVTSLELVTGIIILPQRQTALVAKQAAEVDLLTEGRFRLGVGLGWNAVEYEALGKDFSNAGQAARRADRAAAPAVDRAVGDARRRRSTRSPAPGSRRCRCSDRSRSGSVRWRSARCNASAGSPTAGSRRCRRARSSTPRSRSIRAAATDAGRDPGRDRGRRSHQLGRRRDRRAGRPRQPVARRRRDPPFDQHDERRPRDRRRPPRRPHPGCRSPRAPELAHHLAG